MREKTVLAAVLVGVVCAVFAVSSASAKSPSGGVSWVPVTKGEKTGYINAKGSWMIRPKYLDGKRYSNGLAAVLVETKKGPRWGYINGNGTMVVRPKYDRAMPFRNGLALVGSTGCEWIDDEGKSRIKFDAESCGTFSYGLAHVLVGHHWGYINLNGAVAIAPKWDRAWQFVNGRARVRKDGMYGFIDTSGKVVVDVKYHEVHDFSEDMAAVLTDDGWGFVNKFGRFLIKPKFEDVDRGGFSQKLAAVSIDGKWGYVNRRGSWEIEPKFTLAGTFRQNRAAVSVGGLLGDRTGYINPYGTWVIKAVYDDGEAFEAGVAFVMSGEDTHVITRKGTKLLTTNP